MEIEKIEDLSDLISDLKAEVRKSRIKAAVKVNQELITLYWKMGNLINQKAKDAKWGSKVLDDLAKELRKDFPEMKGISKRNLELMRQFATMWTEDEIAKQAVSQLGWGHNILLMQKLDDKKTRLLYAKESSDNGWSRSVLSHQIGSKYHLRLGKAVSNFEHTIPPESSDIAQKMLMDPHDFEYLDLIAGHTERDIEDSLVEKVQEFMQHYGKGNLAFVGRQWHVEVDGDDFYIDLLFYHLKLHAYVVIELKQGKFKVGDLAQTKFYTTVIDKQVKGEMDGPTIGLLICGEKNDTVAKYAMEGYKIDEKAPLSISQYTTTLGLPSPEEIESAIEE